ncbi:zinc finger, CCHC-type containing protein [Tanacetum coccineum]
MMTPTSWDQILSDGKQYLQTITPFEQKADVKNLVNLGGFGWTTGSSTTPAPLALLLLTWLAGFGMACLAMPFLGLVFIGGGPQKMYGGGGCNTGWDGVVVGGEGIGESGLEGGGDDVGVWLCWGWRGREWFGGGRGVNQAEKYVYSNFDETGKEVIIYLYVDDMLIFGTDQVQVDLTKEFLSSRFSMKDIGEADVILGIRIKHESNGITISQSHYIEKVLKKFNYFDCTLVSTPMDTSEKLMPNNGQVVSQLEYSRVIGCLISKVHPFKLVKLGKV